jgi:D-hexose-6-phosphate mutarotase
MNDLIALNRQFGVADRIRFEQGNGGLTRIILTSPLADGEVYLHGAHVTRYQQRDQPPILFMSAASQFAAGKPIRGGVPICFPWFGPKAGDAKAPAHGFARLMEWSVDSARANGQGAMVTLKLTSNAETKIWWPADFVATYTITVGQALHLALSITNTGSAPCQFEEAMHTYLSIGDIETLWIEGLGGATFIDKMNAGQRTVQHDDRIRFVAETDRVYLDTRSTCTVHDPALGRVLRVEKTGSDATVIWNPWIAKARAMADFGDSEWPGMVCVETCNVADHAVTIAPGATHTLTAEVSAVG